MDLGIYFLVFKFLKRGKFNKKIIKEVIVLGDGDINSYV